jgi:hypothetical protein
MSRNRGEHAALITDAPRSRTDEFESRRKRYAIMMGLRALCVIGAAATYRYSVVIALVMVVGGAVLPWCAVILANDGPPRKRRPVSVRVAAPAQRAIPQADDGRTIEG